MRAVSAPAQEAHSGGPGSPFAALPQLRMSVYLLDATSVAASAGARAPSAEPAAVSPSLHAVHSSQAGASSSAAAGAAAGSSGPTPIAFASFLVCNLLGAWWVLALVLRTYRTTVFLAPLERPG